MSQGFRKFRRRMLFASIWRSVLPGASVALVIFAALFTLNKRLVLSVPLPLCAALGLLSGFLLAGGLFALLFPYKKRLARQLDKELMLRESVQTMLAFSDRQDVMMQLQREQTDAKLQATPARKLKIKHLGTCVICLVLAAGLSVTAFAIPAKQPEPQPEPIDPPFELGEWETLALEELIREVQESDMTEQSKTQTVQALQKLLTELQQTKTQSRMKTLVVNTVVSVRAIVQEAATLRSFSPILRAAGSQYTKELDMALGSSEQEVLVQKLNALAAAIGEDDTFDVAIHVLSEELRMALRSAGVNEQDALYSELQRLADTLANTEAKLPDYSLTWGRNQVNDAFRTAGDLIWPILVQQRYDTEMGVYVQDKLLEIFGLTEQDLPALEQGTEQGPQTPGDYGEDDDDDQTLTDGGLGSGELIVGSQDVIYDPTRADYVKYSEVIDIYNAIFLEKKIDGVLSEEMAALIEAYFTALFSPSNKD